MNLVDLLTLCRERNVQLRLNEGKLKVVAPVGALTDELRQLLKDRKDALVEALSLATAVRPAVIGTVPQDGDLPLSFAQKRLWFLNQLDEGGLYNVGGSFAIQGGLDTVALEQALAAIVRRHSILRTVYQVDKGEPVQRVLADTGLTLDRFELSGSQPEREVQWLALSAEYAARPFDLASDLMLRVGLVTCGPDETRLMIHMHHIAADGWSLSLFIKELNALYCAFSTGQPDPLPPLALQYSDYAHWQQASYGEGEQIHGWSFWRDYLKDLPEVHGLPLDAPRPAEQSHRGDVVRTHVPQAVAQRLADLGQAHGATLFITLYSALSVLLARYSGEDDVVVGTPIAGRIGVEVEPLIGCFVNTLVLRARVDGERTFEELLRQCRQDLLEAYQYQHVPFEYLVEALNPNRHLQYNPLFQVMFTLHNQERTAFALGDARFVPLGQESKHSKFDLSVDAVESADGIDLVWRYATDIFRTETIQRLGEYFGQLLRAIAVDAARPMRALPLLPAAAEQALLTFAAHEVSLPASLGEAFERAVQAHSEQPALLAELESYTYAELAAAVEKAARVLVVAGVGHGNRVGVYLESSPELVIVTLAIFKLGAVYVPLDPAYPLQRLQYMVQDSGAVVVIAPSAKRALVSQLGGHALYWDEQIATDADLPATRPTAADPAYLIYTSGSTGLPKGVSVSHGAVLHYHDAVRDHYGVGRGDRVLQFSSPSFDIYIEELTAALLGGAALVIRGRGAHPHRHFWDELHALGISVVSLPTAYWQLLCADLHTLAHPLPTLALRLLIVGGEKMTLEALQQWRQAPALAGTRLLNTYGPTEATVIATLFDATEHDIARGEIPIGAPLRHSHCLVRDAVGALTAPGAVGELTIVGPTVADGYHNKPEQTQAAFVDVVDAAGAHHRGYRTGDLVRLNCDGQLEYAGRRDDQVKISGFRITTGEIERQILKVPGVSAALVLLDTDPRASAGRLLGVLVIEDPGEHDGLMEQVHHHLKANLPYYMCPGAYTTVQALPITANGKVDRQRLLQHAFRAVNSLAVVPPATPTEQALARLWSERLRVDLSAIGRSTSFFELGGHSLLAIRLLNDIQRAFGLRLGVRQIFESPLLCELALRIDGDTPPVQALTARYAMSQGGELPLSFAQKRLWFLNRIDDSGLYNLGGDFAIRGEPNVAALEMALNAIVQRHTILRTVYGEMNGEPYQCVRNDARLTLDQFQLHGSDAERELQWRRISADYADRPFNLGSDLMLRAGLVTLSSDQSRLMLQMHHIAADGWSMAVLMRELAAHYQAYCEGSQVQLAPLELQYSDYARGQNEAYGSGEEAAGWEFWREYLKDIPEVHSIPLDLPRPAEPSYRGAAVRVHVPQDVAHRLRALAQANGATLFITLYAAFSLMLSRYSGEDDIVVGTPIADRIGPELEPLIGCFINTLVLRARVDRERSFEHLLRQCRQELLDAYQFQCMPFEYLVEALKPNRNLQYNPIFQVMFALHNQERGAGSDVDSIFAPLAQDAKTSKFDLSLDAIETPDGIDLVWRYATDLFREQSVRRMSDYFNELLQSIATDSGQPMRELSMLPASTRQQLLEFPAASKPADHLPANLGQAFDHVVRAFPDSVALVAGDRQWAYAELAEAVEDWMRVLVRAGVGPGDRIGVYLESSPELIITTLAIFRLGAVYVPLDPQYPQQRLHYMVRDSRAKVVVAKPAHSAVASELGADVLYWGEAGAPADVRIPEYEPTADCPAYVIYTSGSTGQPKGVVISHGNVLHYHDSIRGEYAVSGRDRVLQFSSPSFDIYIEELTIALFGGAALVLRDRSAQERRSFWDEIAALQITILSLPTAYWHLLCSELASKFDGTGNGLHGLALRLCIVGGEKMSLEMLRQWQQAQALANIRLLNVYGPTETTVIITLYDATRHPIESGEIPIGRPLHHGDFVICDADGALVLPGAVGELTIAGKMVALEYLNKPEQTQAVFGEIADASGVSRHRSYRTGDLVRLNCDGDLEYVGRRDDQIKISGFRITTGEIERQILLVPGVSSALVLLDTDPGSQSGRLLGVLVVDDPDAHEALMDRVHHHLKASLPYYMWPSAYTVVQTLPLTANGKVDRTRLLQHAFRTVSSLAVVPPATPTERTLAGLWSQRLRVDLSAIGRSSSFFEIGGHSLLAIRLIRDVQQAFGKRLVVRQIFESPLLCELAAVIDEISAQGSQQIEPDPALPTSVPASYAQKQLWYLEQITRNDASYNICETRRYPGRLDLSQVEQAVAEVIRRHSVLRTRLHLHDGVLMQTVSETHQFRLGEIDFAPVPGQGHETALKEAIHACGRRRFDLDVGLPIRMDAVHLEDETLLCLCLHHVAADGWSVDLLWKEFEEIYAALAAGQVPALPTPALQYIDYAAWQARQLAGGALSSGLEYWARQLADAPPLHALTPDFPRPDLQTFEGESYRWRLSDDAHAALRALAARHQASTFMVLHAVFSLLLARRTGVADILIGTPAANRDRPELAGVVGLFANVVVLRTTVDLRLSFAQFLKEVRSIDLEAQDHQEVPFDCLVERLNPHRSAAYNPIVQLLLAVEQANHLKLPTGGGRFVDNQAAKFDLSLGVIATNQGMALEFNYPKALYARRTIQALAAQLTALIDDLAHRPEEPIGQLNLIDADERRWLLEASGRPTRPGAAPGDRLYLLDAAGQLAPLGAEGELHVGGERVARIAAAANAHKDQGGTVLVDVDLPADRTLLRTGRRMKYNHEGVLVEAHEASRRYWQAQLADLPPRHGLPMLEAGLQERGNAGEAYEWRLPAALSAALEAQAAAQGLSLFMLLHAGLSLLISRYSGDRDVVIGTPTANRLLAQFEPLVGLFTNALVLRTDCAAERSLPDFLQHVRQVNLDAFAHQGIPFEQVVDLLNPPRSEYHTPLFQIMLTADEGVRADPRSTRELSDGPAGFTDATQEKVDLSVHVSPRAEGYWVALNFRTALFPRWLIAQMAQDWTGILEQLAQGAPQQLKDLALVPSATFRLPPPPAPEAAAVYEAIDEALCLHTLVEQQVQRTPEAVAVRCGEATLSYAQLNARANRVAHALQAQGVAPGTLVGVCLPRSLELVVALLAILKTGAAYVPLDPDYPVERLRYIAQDAKLAHVLASPATTACLDGTEVECLDVTDADSFAAHRDANPNVAMDATHLAYLIYTSGTTGQPKGVMIEHRNAAALLAWTHRTYTPPQLAVVLAATSMCFDLSVFEMFAPLTCGGSCLLVKHILDLQSDGVRERGVTLVNTVPSAIVQLLESGPLPDSVQVVNLAGEALLAPVVERVYAQPQVQAVYNLYGPSEDTTYSTFALCPRDGSAPDIGIPIRGCHGVVIDAQGLPAPRGVAGELYIGGTGLSRGYWNRPALTAEKYVAGASVGIDLPRLYRTGDLVRVSGEGVLEFIGRLDQQVKLNGFRIELGEIESALSASGAVKSSGVLKIDTDHSQHLVAFVEYLPGGSEAQAREHLRATLPGFMLPQEWIAVDAMALSANGKIDRKALRARYLSQRAGQPAPGTGEAAATAQEQWMVELWMRLLKVEQVGVTDNFFALGGRSLLALQVVNAVNQAFGSRLSMVDVFKFPTVRELTGRLEHARQDAAPDRVGELVQLQRAVVGNPGPGQAPTLFLVHPIGGEVACYDALLARLDRGWNVYGLQLTQEHRLSVPELAQRYLELVRTVQADGAYHLGGYSLGGMIAFEMARQLEADGVQVASLNLLDSMLFDEGEVSEHASNLTALASLLDELGLTDRTLWRGLDVIFKTHGLDTVMKEVLARGVRADVLPGTLTAELLRERYRIYRSNWEACRRYAGGAYAGEISLLACTRNSVPLAERGWQPLARVHSAEIDCGHFELLRIPHVDAVAAWLSGNLRCVGATAALEALAD